jgi:hypothetical protein
MAEKVRKRWRCKRRHVISLLTVRPAAACVRRAPNLVRLTPSGFAQAPSSLVLVVARDMRAGEKVFRYRR